MQDRFDASDGEDIEATLNYSAGAGQPAVFHASAGGEGRNIVDGQFEQRTVKIANGRNRIGDFGLDSAGFELVRHETAVRDFYDPDQIERVYEPEVAKLVQSLTGASRILIFDHTYRTDSDKVRQARQVRDAVPLVHNDYTDRSAPQRVRDLLPAGEADALPSARFAIINLWRSVGEPVETTPLAMCDARSIRDADLLAMERRARDRVGEMQQATYDADHRWYYFPKMDRNEALVFKTYDSAMDGRARRSLHSAFANPTAASDAPPRESIETRMFAFFEE